MLEAQGKMIGLLLAHCLILPMIGRSAEISRDPLVNAIRFTPTSVGIQKRNQILRGVPESLPPLASLGRVLRERTGDLSGNAFVFLDAMTGGNSICVSETKRIGL